jgi:hypothetical protein
MVSGQEKLLMRGIQTTNKEASDLLSLQLLQSIYEELIYLEFHDDYGFC